MTIFGKESTIFRRPSENQDVQKQINFKCKNKQLFASIFLLIIFPELLIYSGNIGIALLLYAGTFLLLTLISIFVNNQEIQDICQVFLLLPILRFINFSAPMFLKNPLLSFVFIYAPITIPISIIVIRQHFTNEQLGLKFKNLWYYFPVSIFIGFILGVGESSIMKVTPFIPDLSGLNLLKLIIVMLFVGIIEEIIFRSILQTKLEEIFGKLSGLILASLIFGFMNSGYGTLYEVFYAFSVGLLIGYIFQKTKSLAFIALVHSFIGIFSVGVIPIVGNGLGIF